MGRLPKEKKQIPQSELNKVEKFKQANVYGGGSITVIDNGTMLKYQKMVNGRRVAVRATKVSELFNKMQLKERENKKVIQKSAQRLLQDEMLQWLEEVKKPKLKQKSYDRLITTYKYQIKDTRLGRMRINSIKPEHIRNHLNTLNEQGYSFSTIKKVHDMIKPFFKYIEKTLDENPMDQVEMINITNIKKQTKQVNFLPDNLIQGFTDYYNDLSKVMYHGFYSYRPTYYLAAAFTLDIYTGLRAGELIALRWKNVDLKRKYIYVNSTIEEVSNPEYDDNRPELMKRSGIKKRIHVEYETKNYSYRSVPLCKQAIEVLKFIEKYSSHTKPDDFVIATKNGTNNTVSNMNTTLNRVYTFVMRKIENEKNLVVDVSNISLQVLRHTCASLLFRHTSLRLEEIASIMGHSPEVCRKTYIHLVEERKSMGMKQMSNIDFGYDFKDVKLPS